MISFMNRTVKTEILEEALRLAGNRAVEKLAVLSRVSARVIARARAGEPPKKELTRQLLAEAVGCTEDALFPLASAKAARKRVS